MVEEQADSSLFEPILNSLEVLLEGVKSSGDCVRDTEALVFSLRGNIDQAKSKFDLYRNSGLQHSTKESEMNLRFVSFNDRSALDDFFLEPLQIEDQDERLDPNQFCQWVSKDSGVEFEPDEQNGPWL